MKSTYIEWLKSSVETDVHAQLTQFDTGTWSSSFLNANVLACFSRSSISSPAVFSENSQRRGRSAFSEFDYFSIHLEDVYSLLTITHRLYRY
jgi:hypothetical protein